MSMNITKKLKCICQICNVEFFIWNCWYKKGSGKCCSRKCKGVAHSKLLKERGFAPMKGKKHKPETIEAYKIYRKTKEFYNKTQSFETRKKRSESAKKTRKPIYREISPRMIRIKLRRSFEYKEWRRRVFQRDNYTCQMCFTKGGYLEADHIKSFSKYPGLRIDINNGRTLCKPCHLKVTFQKEV